MFNIINILNRTSKTNSDTNPIFNYTIKNRNLIYKYEIFIKLNKNIDTNDTLCYIIYKDTNSNIEKNFIH